MENPKPINEKKGISPFPASARQFAEHKSITGHYQRVLPLVRSFVLQNRGQMDDANDVFQEAMSLTWNNLLEGKVEMPDDGKLDAYVITLAKRRWLDRLRSASFRNELKVVKDDVQDVPEDQERLEQIESLKQAIGRLGDTCQELLQLFYFRGLDQSEMALKLGYDAGSIRTMKYRCMNKLKALLH